MNAGSDWIESAEHVIWRVTSEPVQEGITEGEEAREAIKTYRWLGYEAEYHDGLVVLTDTLDPPAPTVFLYPTSVPWSTPWTPGR